jgi:hypothetical protein
MHERACQYGWAQPHGGRGNDIDCEVVLHDHGHRITASHLSRCRNFHDENKLRDAAYRLRKRARGT